jgi:hypothetical protein
MKRRDYSALVADVRRLRPIVVVALAAIALLPSFVEMATQNLAALTVLVRLAESLVLIGVLVWGASAVVLHYARIQVESQGSGDQEAGTHS